VLRVEQTVPPSAPTVRSSAGVRAGWYCSPRPRYRLGQATQRVARPGERRASGSSVCFYGCPHNYAARAGGAVSYSGRGIVKIRSKRKVVSPPLFASSWGGISMINFIAILSGQRAALVHRRHLPILTSTTPYIFIVNLRPLPSCSPPKRFQYGEMWGLSQRSTVYRPPSFAYRPFRPLRTDVI
jgi:hypothetical protein